MSAQPAGREACWSCGAAAAPAEADRAPGYQRCQACGLLFQPERSRALLRELYDAGYFERFAGGGDYTRQDAQRRREARVRVRLVARWTASGRLLELGSAGGHFLAAARDAGFDPHGIEPGEELARRARDELGLDVRTGFVEDLDLEPAGYDVVCAWHVLEHMSRPRETLERLRRALRPGGLLFAEVPNVDSFPALAAGATWAQLEPLHHVAHFGPRSLRALLELSGFVVVASETVPFFSYLRARTILSEPRHLWHRLNLSYGARVRPWGSDPWKHELLRAVARAPG